MNEKKIIISAVLLLLVGFLSFRFGADITGNPVVNKYSKIIVQEDSVMEGETVTVTVIPGLDAVVNEGTYLTSPVYIHLYRRNIAGYDERIGGQSLKVCDGIRCTERVTKIFRISSDLIPSFEPSQGFCLKGFDEAEREIQDCFTVTNKDKLTPALHL